MATERSNPESDPIAIIGMGCRLPNDIISPSALWEFLAKDGSACGKVPASRFNIDSYHGATGQPATASTLGGYFLNEDLKQFDNNFFGIHNREASIMDPQQRKLLEVVFECFESAGVSLDNISSSNTGCYVASFTEDFFSMQTRDAESLTRFHMFGTGTAMLANRISHVFNLKGPSCVINTGCSASLFALHAAYVALLAGECDSAIVAGVNLIQMPEPFVGASLGGILSETSACHTFDVCADGYGRADGINAVLLKRLSDAIHDGDPIRSVIRSVAVNSNGRTSGLAQPDPDGQEAVIKKAYARAGLDPSDTLYVETHGTGTSVGDPIEIEALSRVFTNRIGGISTLVGSVKPNLGHSEAASGLTSIIKATLALEKSEIPATIGINNINPKLKVEGSGIEIVTKKVPFPKNGTRPCRISVNSFGYGGANGHGILEAASPNDTNKVSIRDNRIQNVPPEQKFLLPFSASCLSSLIGRVQSLYNFDLSSISVTDLAYTLGQRRSHLAVRGYIIASQRTISSDVAVDNLRLPSYENDLEHTEIALVFTGQGAQWKGMAKQLMQFSTFARTIRELDSYLDSIPHGPQWSLYDVLTDESDAFPINQAYFAQPITTAIQIGIVKVLRAWGISPVATIGHSSGEIAAAYAAGVLTPEEAIGIAFYRGFSVMKMASAGAMAAVGLGPDDANTWIENYAVQNVVKVACVNSPQSVTISGDSFSVDVLIAAMEEAGIFVRRLKTDGKAYHSSHMAEIGPAYEKFLRLVLRTENREAMPTRIPMFSTVVCHQVNEEQIRHPSYWRQNLESPVRFSEGIARLSKIAKNIIYVEIGPHAALKAPIIQCLGNETRYLATQVRGKDSAATLLNFIGDLYTRGFNTNFAAINEADETQRSNKVLHDLPNYAWHYEEPLWIEPRVSRETRFRRHARHELLGSEVPGGNKATLGWRNVFQLEHVPWLRDHKLGDIVVFPAAAYLAMAIEALVQTLPPSSPLSDKQAILRHVHILKALALNEEDSLELYTELRPLALTNMKDSKYWWEFQISSIFDDVATVRCKGSVRFGCRNSPSHLSLPLSTCQLGQQTARLWYGAFENAGLGYGPEFQNIDNVYTSEPKGTLYTEARIRCLYPNVNSTQKDPRYFLHPVLIDSALQAGLIARAGGLVNYTVAKVPIKIGEARFSVPITRDSGLVRASAEKIGVSTDRINTALFDNEYRILAHLHDIDVTTYVGCEHIKEMRHPVYRLNWKPDLENIDTPQRLSQALDYMLSISELGSLGSRAPFLAALDIITHKNPDCHILCLSRDLDLLKFAFTEVLEVQSQFRRFASFSLGRFTSNNVLEVAEVRNFNVPLELESLTYESGSNHQYGIVILSEEVASLASICDIIAVNTVFLRNIGDEMEFITSLKGFSIISSKRDQYKKIQLIKPLRGALSISYPKIIHICASTSRPQDAEITEALSSYFGTPVQQIPLKDLTESRILQGTLVISTCELKESVLVDPRNEDFAGLKTVVCKADKIVWVSGSGHQSGFNPSLSIFTGLAKTIRIEYPSTQIFTLEVDPKIDPRTLARDVVVILRQENGQVIDYEYMKDTCGLMVCRVVPDELMNQLFRERKEGIPISTSLAEAGTVGLSIKKPGQLSTLQFEPMPQHNPENIPAGDILVKIAYIGLNAKNVYALAGQANVPLTACNLGYTGKIVAVGPGVEDLAPEDSVAVFYPSPFSNYATVPRWSCVMLRDDDDICKLASTLLVLVTVLYALDNRANLQDGESVLIHSAAGAVGIAAIQYSKLIGAEVYATVGTEEKKEYLMKEFGIPPNNIFDSHDSSFASGIKSATKGRGVDVILNSLVGELLHEGWECLADFGRFVEIGKRDILDGGRLNMHKFSRCTTFTAFDLQILTESACPAHHFLHQSLLQQGVKLLRSGQIEPISPFTVFPVSDVSSAFHYFNRPDRMGKIVISLEDQSQAIPVLPEKYSTKLNPLKSYLLVGCLGGLGRSISKWMWSRGARHFVFLGRTGLDRPAAKELVNELRLRGANVVVVTGDVCDYDSVERAVAAAPIPVGGVIQAAMGLDVGMFDTMTKKSWVEGINAKVKGTWNLHNVLSKLEKEQNLDFFIMLSSMAGQVGTAGESNYSAANHFLDVFARYRRSLGLVAVSLGMGMISEVGFLHEHPRIAERLLQKGIRPLSEDDLLQVFDYGISGPPSSVYHGNLSARSHILTGFELSGIQSRHKQGYSGYWEFLDGSRFSILSSALKRNITVGATRTWDTYSSTLSEALASKDREILVNTICEMVGKKLSLLMLIPSEKLDFISPLSKFGMDSLLAAEVRQYVLSNTSVDVPFFVLMGEKITVLNMAQTIAQEMLQN